MTIADSHNDFLVDLAAHRDDHDRFCRDWLPNLRAGAVAIQVSAVSVELDQLPELALRRSLEQIRAAHQIAAAHPSEVMVVRDRDDLSQAGARGAIAMVLALEGVEPLGYSPELIDIFWLLGVRIASLTWNRQNPFAGGAAEAPTSGVTALGHQLLDLMLARGFVLDLAHASERTFLDVIERAGSAGTPVIVSHACCRAVFDTPRNVADEQLRALADLGGLLGIMAIPLGVDPQAPTIDRLVDHIEHAAGVIGIEHVCLGGDFMAQLVASGVEPPFATGAFLPPGVSMGMPLDGLAGPEDYGTLIAALDRRGFAPSEIAAIASGNLTRFLQEALPHETASTAALNA